MYDCHLRSKLRQHQGFLHRRVSPTHHNHFFIPEKSRITSCTRRDAFPNQFLFRRQTQPIKLCPGSYNNCFAQVLRVVSFYHKRLFIRFHFQCVSVFHFHSKFFRLLSHTHHQIRPLNPFRKSRKIFHQSCLHQLPAPITPGDTKRLQIRPRGINTGSQSRRPAPNNNHIKYFLLHCATIVSQPTFQTPHPFPSLQLERLPVAR